MLKLPVILLATLPLAACISFGAEPPPSLLTLTTEAAVTAGQPQSSATAPTILINVPAVPQKLSVLRVPVQTSETSIAYVKDAQWVEPPAQLFARLMADTITARTGRVVLSGSQSRIDPGSRLSGELRDFGIDAASQNAVVIYDGALIRNSDGAVEKQRFEARVPVATVDASAVGAALNQAANQVAGQVADWVGR
ncbi:ABC-type transport auxiliary lipoprotein family protein [Hephaestia sp. GCM10023244]|uniref:ABC-type transport auxiliary lipoprotein family protein n=1 Tax=unclassified Hephaestia TaxID=2631281 RepID=UPI0020774338|nr:ABC-type transport auxiliary lipoprotein family protein [Hephaestia sp. MAHUQ-44]MCM8729715.1 ABC-type transport auxiliary lipoprotein family protein [Hephaestia sp. MAHUQ-44]